MNKENLKKYYNKYLELQKEAQECKEEVLNHKENKSEADFWFQLYKKNQEQADDFLKKYIKCFQEKEAKQ